MTDQTHTDQTLSRTQNGRSNFALQTYTLSSQSHERGRKILERERKRLGCHCLLHTNISTAFTQPIMILFHWYLSRPNLNDNIIWHSIKYILRTSDIVIFAAIWERFNISCCLDIRAERTKSKACKAHFQQGLQTTNYQAMTSVSKVRICNALLPAEAVKGMQTSVKD